MASVIGRFVARGVVTVLSIAVVTATPQDSGYASSSTLATFDERIAEYAGLHRRLGAQLPPPETSTDPERFMTYRGKLAAAIKTARPRAGLGDFFDPSVAPVFRRLIAKALYGLDVESS